jgi:hypothetical protein
MSSPSVGYWSALGDTFLHPINTAEMVAGEVTDSTFFGGLKTAVTGAPSQSQVDAIAAQASQNVINAGGSQADADAAAAEVQSYVQSIGGTAEQNLPSKGTLLGLGTGTLVFLGLIAWILHEL